jgi:hypothetical protein
MMRVTLIVLAGLAWTSPSFAQPDQKVDAKLHADVVKLVEASGERENMQKRLPQQLDAARFRMMSETCKGCDPAFGEEWVKQMSARTKIDDYVHVIEHAYETHLTDDEVLQMLALQTQSKAGQKPTPSDALRQKLVAAMPSIQNEIAKKNAEASTKLGTDVRAELEKQHPEWFKNMQKP